ncbi:hypothetical protein [Desulfosudis oleivorans]|uniref:Uncharacterized protein n=1 Tax=Desulfosudis oleivorans (strain DSM 6200 / JCM 39069 / Hxd3) TaxID=96561 RepID=A8ZYY0_DESOH|nr:hypothetical protein [Desulfosudis oleivorans]ABW68753.1 hypothetical protein Dole_2950 [Desulfosudis oleivorans Hxd3]
MNNNLKTRIEALEKVMAPIDWEPVEIHIYVEDCSIAGQNTPEELLMVIKSGTPAKHGRTYHRGADETAAAFLARCEAAELAA